METKLIRVLAVLGVPGVALGIFYLILKKFNFEFEKIGEFWSAIIAILFLLIVGGITLYTLRLWAPKKTEKTLDNEHAKNPNDKNLKTETNIVLKLSDEIQNKNIIFGLLHVRDGKDQVDDKGQLLNKEIYFKELDRHGTLHACVLYTEHLGFQFKCFVDHKGVLFEEVKKLLMDNNFKSVSQGGGKKYRAWFLLQEYGTCNTVDGIINNFFYPA